MSSSQGQGGSGKSQAQVQVNSKTGGTSATSQSGGEKHQSESEVQANEQGGLANAQSSGPGQTSSQAQIGFRPQVEDNEEQNNMFNGGGQASSQSGAHSGQSQSQINGRFKLGISYHGAAQAASGTKEQVASYNKQSAKLFESIGQLNSRSDRNSLGADFGTPTGGMKRRIQTPQSASNNNISAKPALSDSANTQGVDDSEYEEKDEEYEEEDYENIVDKKPSVKIIKQEDLKSMSEPTPMVATSTTIKPPTSNNQQPAVSSGKNYNVNTAKNSKIFSQNSPNQKQVAAIANPTGQKYHLKQTQNGKAYEHSGPEVTSSSTTSTTTEIPTSTIKPKSLTTTRHLPTKHVLNLSQHRDQNKETKTTGGNSDDETPNSYVTVTKSVTGIMDETKSPPEEKKKFASTYYSKSSTCGFMTMACNKIYGANGYQTICRPKAPSNVNC